MDIDAYLEKMPHKAQRSALAKFEAEIFKLREGGLSLQQIVMVLSDNGVAASVGNLSKFLRKSRPAAATAPDIPTAPPDYLTRKLWTAKPEESELVRPAGMTDAGWREALLAHTKRSRTK